MDEGSFFRGFITPSANHPQIKKIIKKKNFITFLKTLFTNYSFFKTFFHHLSLNLDPPWGVAPAPHGGHRPLDPAWQSLTFNHVLYVN